MSFILIPTPFFAILFFLVFLLSMFQNAWEILDRCREDTLILIEGNVSLREMGMHVLSGQPKKTSKVTDKLLKWEIVKEARDEQHYPKL